MGTMREGKKTRKRDPLQEWPGGALHIHKSRVCTELTISMILRPAFASAEPGKQRGLFQRRASSLNRLLQKEQKYLLSG